VKSNLLPPELREGRRALLLEDAHAFLLLVGIAREGDRIPIVESPAMCFLSASQD
jgi:hypothetical protein